MSDKSGADEQTAALFSLLEQAQHQLARFEAKEKPVAVISLAFRFPGDAFDEERYWRVLSSGDDCVIEVPKDRWDVEAFFDVDPDASGKMTTRFGGFLTGTDITAFDAAYFGIAPKEARSMDPQQRMLLETVAEALEKAGYRAEELRGSKTGVFVGISTVEYADLASRAADGQVDGYMATGGSTSVAAGRISYTFGFQGPSVALDTACSSGLHALHLAANALRNSECDLAIVAATNLLLDPETTVMFSKGGFMAPDGHCKAFDASANGYVRSEGVAVVVIKRQSDAENAGDRIRALVRGSATNQDGRSGGLTVPNGPAQEAAIRDALARGRVRAEDVDYVEAHGTGTQLGDPIEVNALSNVYGADRASLRPVLFGSVKTNIGHLEAVAGLAGLIKIILAFERCVLPAQIHLSRPNQKIPWSELNVCVLTKSAPWPRRKGKKRIAALSAFAFQGSNAHVIIEEAPAQKRLLVGRVARVKESLVISAKSAEALRGNVEKWQEYLQTTESPLQDIAYTALNHRTAHLHKVVVEAKDAKDAGQKLAAYLRGESGARTSIEGSELEALKAETKAAGGERVDVPTYAFHRQRYWVEEFGPSQAGGENTGYDLLGGELELAEGEGQRVFSSEVNKQWPGWLKDHVVQGEVVVPGAALVELLLEAAKATEGSEAVEQISIERALVVQGSVQLQTRVSASGEIVVHARSGKHGTWQVHARGKVAQASVFEREAPESLQSALKKPDKDLYASFEKGGLGYGVAFQTLKRIAVQGEGVVSSEIESESAGKFLLSPMLLDGCLQSFGLQSGGSEAYLPIGFAKVSVKGSAAKKLYGRCELEDGEFGKNEVVKAKIGLYDEDGEQVCVIEGASFKRARAGAIANQMAHSAVAGWLYETRWRAVELEHKDKAEPEHWLVASGERELGAAQKHAESLVARGNTAEAIGYKTLAAKLKEKASAVLWVVARADEEESSVAKTLQRRNEETLRSLLEATQQASNIKRLVVLTEGAQAVEGQVKRPWHSSVWGFVRVLTNEHPELAATLIDVADYDQSANEVSWELRQASEEEEVGYYSGKRYAPRLVHQASDRLSIPEAANFALKIRNKGKLDELKLEVTERIKDLKSGFVEVEVECVGLNFRDVLNAMGMYPGDAGELGGDFGGRVSRVSDKSKYQVGDRVYGMANGAFSHFAVTDERLIAKVPKSISNEEAATLVSTYLTVFSALDDHAKLKAKERVLIHSAAGGVGLSAVMVAKERGAEIFATASRSKHAYLRSLGVKYVYDSRSSAFYEEILKDTANEGVDVVLNSLTEDKLKKSLQLLREGGRFVEIGKAELLTKEQAKAVNSKASYVAVAVDEASRTNPQWFEEAYAKLKAGLESGQLQALKYERSSVSDAKKVFRQMAQGKNVGKLVIAMSAKAAVSAEGSYVITGGLGAIGRQVGIWLSEQGAKDIVLIGRSGPGPEAKAAIEKMKAHGASITVEAVDVANEEQLKSALERARKRAGKITGVMHAAGVLEDATIREQSWDKFERVFSAKVIGAELLRKLAPEAESIECFGSIASVFGSGGQSNYAAANAYLSALGQTAAPTPKVQTPKVQTVDWWAWAEGGMAKALSDKRSQSQFEHALTMKEGLSALSEVMQEAWPSVSVTPLDFAQAVKQSTLLRKNRFKELTAYENKAGATQSEFAKKLHSLSEAERKKYVEERVKQEVQAVLGTSQDIPKETGLMDLGIDSLMAVELRNRLGQLVGKTLPATLVFDYPSVQALCLFLLQEAGEIEAPKVKVRRRTSGTTALGIVGISCRLPGGANDLQSYWKLLSTGQSGIGEVPKDRWDIDEYYDADPDAAGKMSTRYGGFLKNYDVRKFDAEYFGISPKEARSMDPQQRLILECAIEALEDAGIAPQSLVGTQTGVFVGMSSNDYAGLQGGEKEINSYLGTGNAMSVAAGRLSYSLGLQGPAFALDTACSSSLYALHQASASLRAGECDLAIVAGVNLILTPGSTIYFSKGRFMAADGQCKTFDASADGYVRSEGIGVVVLERQSDAKKTQRRVRALIRGSATNQDGRSGGLTVPNGPAQEAVIREALARAEVEPADVSYVEAHGTGTQLGDPIEANALAAAYGDKRKTSAPLVLGSVKTNIGHLEAAAGMASLIKLILAFEHEEIPGQRNLHKLNEKIAWNQLPLQVATQTTVWKRSAKKRRIAALSAFAFQGSNAHVIIEEAPAHEPPTASRQAREQETLVISAKSEEALRANVEKWQEYLQTTESPLQDIAYTALNHRTAHLHKVVVEAKDAKDAGQKLAAYLRGESGARTSIEGSELEALKAETKAAGGERVDVPTYAFHRQRYWVEETGPKQGGGESTGYDLLGGELELAEGEGQRVFSSEVNKQWPGWLKDHVVQGEVVVPGAALVELLLEAAKATEGSEAVEQISIERALVVQGSVQLQTRVSASGEIVVHARSGKHGTWQVHARGKVAQASVFEREAPESLQSALKKPDKDLYASFEKGGLGYGVAFQTLKRIAVQGEGVVSSEIESESAGKFLLSPMLLDGCLQSFGLQSGGSEAYLPIGFAKVSVKGSAAKKLYGRCELEDGEFGKNEVVKAKIGLYDEDGEQVCVIEGASFKRARAGAIANQMAHSAVAGWLYETRWRAVELEHKDKAEPEHWLVASGERELGAAQKHAESLVARGNTAEAIGYKTLAAKLKEKASAVLWVVARADEEESSVAKTLQRRNEETLRSLLEATQQASNIKRLVVLTEGAQAVEGQVKRPWHSSVWGYVRVLTNEHPELSAKLIDVADYDQSANEVSWELRQASDEEEVGYYSGKRYAPRLVHQASDRLSIPEAANFALKIRNKGKLDELKLEATERIKDLKSGFVEVEVECVGLNFRDVLNAMGMYPGDAGELGGDFGGRVSRVSDKSKYQVGDRVYGMANGAFSHFAVTDERLIAKVPKSISNEEAATLVSTYLTVFSALDDHAKLKAKERVLIHSAAGGVGLSAVMVAKERGAEIFATASRSKHAYLRSLGVKYVYDSRSSAFYEEILKDTANEGVDVVLNSLTEDKLKKSLQLLREGGRFVEIGKAELLTKEQAKAVNSKASYVAVAVDEASRTNPQWFEEAYAKLKAGLESGQLQALKYERSSVSDAKKVFRQMAQGKNVGKLVIAMSAKAAVSAEGSYVITGGLGAIGRQVGIWLSEQGAKDIVLIGRSGPGPEAKAAIEKMKAHGASITVEAVDVANEEQLKSALERARKRAGKITGVMHAAGVLEDATIREQSWDKFERVFSAKVIGAELLRKLAPEAESIECFGSIASVFGSGGQSNYAAANAYLSALGQTAAPTPKVQTPKVQTVDWWAWAEGGMAKALSDKRSQSQFEHALTMKEGLSALSEVMQEAWPSVSVTPLDFAQAVKQSTLLRKNRFKELTAYENKAGATQSEFAKKLHSLSEAERKKYVEERVKQEVQAVLGTSQDIPKETGLMDLGIDSLMAVELRNRLGQLVGKTLPATLVFDYPSVQALCLFLLQEAGEIEAPKVKVRRRTSGTTALGIVGISCRLPGGANDLQSYWKLLSTGQSGIGEVPKDRWDIDEYYDADPDAAGKMSTRYGGFLKNYDVRKFDAEYFGISPKEARSMDPQQRLILECAIEALEDAGIAPQSLVGTQTGVFVGMSSNDYAGLQGGEKEINSYLGTGNAMSVAAGRLSYSLGLQGPAFALDTACSSSLYALHQASASLRAGECDLAIVAGVNLILTPGSTIYFSKGRFMAADGQCKTFDASADGYVRSEGIGVVVLERQSDAKKTQRRVRALIRGSATNQDGRSGGLTVPNGPAQEAVIREALARAEVEPADVSYVEAHGTGTQLGDPIEANALAAAYGDKRKTSAPLVLGSVKTNIGHLEAAAGMASLIKLILAFEHEEIPGQRNLHKLNEKIAWNQLPLQVATQTTVWKRSAKKRRIAALSAFAFQGSNAHVIIEEAPAHEPPTASRQAREQETLVISAKSEEALRANVEKWQVYLQQTDLPLQDIAFAALHHRTAHAHKVVVQAKDAKDAAQKLSAYLRGESGARTSIEGSELEALKAETKAAGGERVDVPTYAFHRQRYWVEETGPKQGGGESTGYDLLGGELELAEGEGQRVFSSEVNKQWPAWLKDHVVQGEVVVPGAALVELLLEAAKATDGSEAVEQISIERALVVQGSVQLQTRVSASGEIVVHARSGKHGTWQVHARGKVAQASVFEREAPESLQSALKKPDKDLYASFEKGGLGYGVAFQTLKRIAVQGEGVVSSEIESESAGKFLLSPMLLDGCLQSFGLQSGGSEAYLPIGFAKVSVKGSAAKKLYGRCELEDGEFGKNEVVKAKIGLYDEDGEQVCVIEGASFKRARAGAIANQMAHSAVAGWLYETRWRAVELEHKDKAEPEHWLVASGERELGAAQKHAESLVARGNTAEAIGYKTLAAKLKEKASAVLWVVARADEEESSVAKTLQRRNEETLRSLLEATQQASNIKRLVVLTEGAQAVEGQVKRPWHSSVWGFVRVLTNEHPELAATLIDVADYDQSANEVSWELRQASEEEEVGYYSGKRYAPRLVHQASDRLSIPEAANFALKIRNKGKLDELKLEVTERIKDLKSGFVEVEVECVGLNFRDVLNAMGMYPGDAGELGGDFGGRVSRVSDKSKYQVGDRVYGMANGAFSHFAVTDERLIAKVPKSISNEEAATLVSTYLTVFSALDDHAKLKAKERVLIHSAAGGVGLSAVMVAKERGAEIFATASRSKHAYLRSLGVKYVYDSRSSAFYEEILKDTANEGVDVVLNSLTEDKLKKSLQLLREGGRFVEIGKAELLTKEQAKAVNSKASYVAVAVDEASRTNPQWFEEAYAKLKAGLESGQLQALKYERSSVSDAKKVFRQMAQGKNVGKLVIAMSAKAAVSAEGSYVITGGLGAIGRQVGIWLSEQGAKDIVLIGRSGPGPEAKAAIEKMKAHGASITVEAVDVANEEQLKSALERARKRAGKITGVMHAAGVLEDATIREQSWDKFERVFSAKVIGAELLRKLAPEAESIECFGSIASVFGSGGQSNYAAANAYLSALGQTAAPTPKVQTPKVQTVDWWAWAEGGMAKALSDKRSQSQFEHALTMKEGLSALSEVMQEAWPSVSVTPLDFAQAVKQSTLLRKNRFKELTAYENKAGATQSEFAKKLHSLSEAERKKYVEERVKQEVQAVLGTSQDIPKETGLMDLGIDSLMAVELRNRLGQLVGKTLPVTLVFDHPKISELGAFVLTFFVEYATNRREEGRSRSGTASVVAVAGKKLANQELLFEILECEKMFLGTAAKRYLDRPPSAILVTGGTGFLGAYVVNEILKDPVHVVCLVRAEDEKKALERISSNLSSYCLPSPPKGRVEVVCGDVGEEYFGLGRRVFEDLSERVDGVMHVAGELHYLKSYSSLRKANVLGTAQALLFASRGKTKRLVHVSSFGAFETQLEDRRIPENRLDSLNVVGSTIPYFQTKWVADELVSSAILNDFDAHIVRPPLIAPDAVVGRLESQDLMVMNVDAAIRLGCIGDATLDGDSDTYVDWIPVDSVAKASVSVLMRGGPRFINMSLPECQIRVNDFQELLSACGIALPRISARKWRAEVRKIGGEMLAEILEAFDEDFASTNRVVASDSFVALRESIGLDIDIGKSFRSMVSFLRSTRRIQ